MRSIDIGWKGHEYASKERCRVLIGEDEILINGQIRSRPTDIDLKINYAIRLTAAWETKAVRIAGSFDGKATDFDFQRNGTLWTNWDGQSLADALEPDISLTPLTNTLPLRRLNIAVGESREISVLYFDLEAGNVDLREQRYTRLSERQYRFETVPAGFSANIDVDENGFVLEYPGLFSRQ